nr:hypothetical protein [Rhizobium sp. G21]
MDFLVSDASSVQIIGSQLQIDEISVQWRRVSGDLRMSIHPEEEAKIFFFMIKGGIQRTSGSADDMPHLNAAFPTGRLETIGLDDGCEFISVCVPNRLFQRRLSELMGRPIEKQIAFVDFPAPHLESLQILRDHLNDLQSSNIQRTSKYLGSRNESLRNLVVDCILMMFPNNFSPVLSQDTPACRAAACQARPRLHSQQPEPPFRTANARRLEFREQTDATIFVFVGDGSNHQRLSKIAQVAPRPGNGCFQSRHTPQGDRRNVGVSFACRLRPELQEGFRHTAFGSQTRQVGILDGLTSPQNPAGMPPSGADRPRAFTIFYFCDSIA